MFVTYTQDVEIGDLRKEITSPPQAKTKDAVKERTINHATGMAAMRALVFITAKVALALQAIPPFGVIVAPVIELGRCVDFVMTSVQDLHRLKRSREFITNSKLKENVKKLCLAKLEQDKHMIKTLFAVNFGYLLLATARVVLIAAAIASLASTGAGLPIVATLGLGLVVVANLSRLALDAYARPNTTWENFKGNGLKYFWLNTVVLWFQGSRLEKERERLAEKCSSGSFEIDDQEIKRYFDRKRAFETTVAKIAVLDQVFRRAGMLDLEHHMKRQCQGVELIGSSEGDAVLVSEGDAPEPVVATTNFRSFVEQFSVKTYYGYDKDEQQAFRLIFGIKPEKVAASGTVYLQKRLEVLFSEFSLQGSLGRLELAEGRLAAQIAPYVDENQPPEDADEG